MQSDFLAQTNNFSVPQNFAGIVNSGSGAMASLNCSGNANIGGSLDVGACTVASLVISGVGSDAAAFTANSLAVTNLATFNGGFVNNASGTIATTFGVGGLASLNGGLSVLGPVSLPASNFTGAITGTSAVFSGALQCASEIDTGALTCATMSASGLVSANAGLAVVGSLALPASSVVQSMVSNGYADLSSQQNIAGLKSFSTPPVLSGASISVSSIPASSIVANSITNAQIASPGLAQTSILSGYVDLANPQNNIAGAKQFVGVASFLGGISDSSYLSVSGLTTLATVVLPVAQIPASIVSGVVSVNLGNVSRNEFTLVMSSAITGFNFTNAIVNAKFNIYLLGDPSVSRTMSKNLSNGTFVTKNNLGRTTSIASNSVWKISGQIVSSSICLLDFTNFT